MIDRMNQNYEKRDIYKSMKINLKKAITSGFYYEAIFIEYAIIEDRCTSLLKHAGVKYLDNKGNEWKISEKLRRLRGNPAFDNKYVRKRLTLEFLQEIEDWKRNRDQLIHALAKVPYDNDKIKEIALTGQEIVRVLDNKTKSLNAYFNKHDKEFS